MERNTFWASLPPPHSSTNPAYIQNSAEALVQDLAELVKFDLS